MQAREIRGRERIELMQTLREVGPDAPTLCSKWSAAKIAAHLVVSEQGFGLAMVVGNVVRRLLPPTATRRAIDAFQPTNERLIARAGARGFPYLLRRLEAGPPAAFHRGTLKHLRFAEEWIHHEDIRRANGHPPREGSAQLDELLWAAGLAISRFPEFVPGRESLEMQLPDGRSHSISGRRDVRICGRPGELLLYLAGRTDSADVTVEGDANAIAALAHSLSV